MKFNNKGYLFGGVLLLLLVLVGTVIDKKIFGTGFFVVEKLEGATSGAGDCDDCNKKNVSTSLTALGAQMAALSGKLEGVEGRVGANEAKLVEANTQLLKNTAAITLAQNQMKQLETEINEAGKKMKK